MAQVGALSSCSLVPAPAQAALALAILNVKPSNISVRDYLLKLRAHLRPGISPARSSEANHYIDLVAYWREQYLNTLQECDELRSINVKLERSAHRLASLAVPEAHVNVAPPSPTRRGRTSSPARATKRPRLVQPDSTQGVSADAEDTIERDSVFLDTLGPEGAKLTEMLFITHGLCRASSTENDKLCSALVQTSIALGNVIMIVARHYDELSCRGGLSSTVTSLEHDKSEFSAALSICARAYMSILIGLATLYRAGSTDGLRSLVIYELVAMFNVALQSIHDAARKTAHVFETQRRNFTNASSKEKNQEIKESIPARSVACLLIGFLGHLSKSNEDHQRLFDGFTFTLLDHAAKWLYYCTFGQQRSNMTEENIIPSSEDDAPDDSLEIAVDTGGGRLEMKALVLILERTMGLAPIHMNLQPSRSEKTPTQAGRTISVKNLPTVSRTRLSTQAKDCLQRTLITCMYASKPEDEFLDVLTKPFPKPRLGSLPDVTNIEDKDVNEWYKQEIWRLVGWDILAKENY